MKHILILYILLFNSFPGFSQSSKENTQIPELLEKAVKRFMADTSRVGVSAGIYKAGEIYTYNSGRTQTGKQDQPTAQTLYEIGSITKTFTGLLLAQAVVDGKVKIDDDIRIYLAEPYPNLAYKGHPIRLFHLINHRSRLPFLLPDNLNLSDYAPDTIPYLISAQQNTYSKEAFLKDLHLAELDTIPGTKYGYSNASTQLLGFILEKVYNRSYEDLIRTYILLPAGMKNTQTGIQKNKATFAKGYNATGKLMPYNPGLLLPAGGIYSSVGDMLKYIEFHLNEKNKLIELSHQPTFGDINDFAIGLNWQMTTTPDGLRKIWQSGGTFGFSSYLVIYPQLNMGIVLLSNQADQTAQGSLENTADSLVKAIHTSGTK